MIDTQAPPIEPETHTEELATLPSAPDAERDLVGVVLYDGDRAFDLASLKSSDFYILRWRWVWEACEAIRAANDRIDLPAIEKELIRAGRFEDVTARGPLMDVYNPNTLHIEADARKVREMAERRRMVTDAEEQARRACDLSTPLPGNQDSSRPRFVIHQAADALQPHPPRQEIVKGLLSIKQLGCFYGEAGSKKSYSLMTLALSVATGMPWLDFETQQARVLYIDEDAGEDGTRERVAECMRGLIIDDASQFDYMSMAGLQLDQDADAAKLETIVREGLYSLVILDAFGDLMSGDENSKEDTAPIMRNLRRIADRTEAALIFIHHANKNGGYRGSSHIKGKLDLMVGVTSENGKPFINFKTDKVRYGQARTWAAQANWGPGQFYLTGMDTLKASSAPLSKSQEFVIKYLTEHGASPIPVIMAGADTCSPEAARKAVYNLAGLRKIYRTNPGETGQGMAAIYDLAKGEDE